MTQHTSLWHELNEGDPLTGVTTNYGSLHTVAEELSINGQHTATYTNRFQFE